MKCDHIAHATAQSPSDDYAYPWGGKHACV